MARTEQMEILRRGRKAGVTTAAVEPGDPGSARQALISWLEAERWDEALWPQFSIMVPGQFGAREVKF